MAGMVSLKRKPGEGEGSYPTDRDDYPWGTRLCLDEDITKKLGASGFSAGQQVVVTGIATVVSTNSRMEVGEEEVEISMSLQLTDMELRKQASVEEKASKLYGSKGE